MEKIFIKTEISKTKKLHKFLLSLSKKSNLKSSSGHVALQNLSIY